MDGDEAEIIEPVAPPLPVERLTNQQILLGQKLDPIDIIKIYSADQWEQFIREWAEALPARYKEVRRASGAGDRGRDIIGYAESVGSGPWDNHQCKHYDHALYPSDIWKELAKLCYYTHNKFFSIPRTYYFVAPRGVGPDALLLLENAENMRARLIARWNEGGLLKVGKQEIQLSGNLLAHVENFDFTIVKDLPPSKIIEQHRQTRFYAGRFGGGLVKLPPSTADVPEEIAAHETRYVEQLLEAYGDFLVKPIGTQNDLADYPRLKSHFDRQRKHFYLAELLRNFTRDNVPEDGCFERLQDSIYDGVIDTAESDFPNGYERIKKTIDKARAIQIDSHPLTECLEGYHRSGVCHQLANTDKLKWVP
jgi:hypothetical protein